MSRAFEQPLFYGAIASIDHIDVSCGRAHKDFRSERNLLSVSGTQDSELGGDH